MSKFASLSEERRLKMTLHAMTIEELRALRERRVKMGNEFSLQIVELVDAELKGRI